MDPPMMPPLAPAESRGGPVPRTDSQRWIVVVVAAVAVLAAAAAGAFTDRSALSPGAACFLPPTSDLSGLAMGSPVPAGGPTDRSYNLTVTPSSGLEWGNLRFLVTSPTGTPLDPGSTWRVVAIEAQTNSPIAVYEFLPEGWTEGASTLMTSGQNISLQLGASNLAGQGDKLVAVGSDTCGG